MTPEQRQQEQARRARARAESMQRLADARNPLGGLLAVAIAAVGSLQFAKDRERIGFLADMIQNAAEQLDVGGARDHALAFIKAHHPVFTSIGSAQDPCIRCVWATGNVIGATFEECIAAACESARAQTVLLAQ